MTTGFTRQDLLPFAARTTVNIEWLVKGGRHRRDPGKIALSHTTDTQGRNRVEFEKDEREIAALVFCKWAKALNDRLTKKVSTLAGRRSLSHARLIEWRQRQLPWPKILRSATLITANRSRFNTRASTLTPSHERSKIPLAFWLAPGRPSNPQQNSLLNERTTP